MYIVFPRVNVEPGSFVVEQTIFVAPHKGGLGQVKFH
jgi:hypothetical protein